MDMTITEDVEAERAAFTESLIELGPVAPTACGEWTALDLAAHVVGEERYGGVTTFIARSLVVRGVSVAGPPKLVDTALRLERRHGFTALIGRLRRPVPRLLLQPRVAPLALFEYWTHHADLIGADSAAHPVPTTLVNVIALLLRYQLKKLPAGVRVTADTGDGNQKWSVGPTSGHQVIVGGSPPDLIRWLAGRRMPSDLTMTGPDNVVQELRNFEGRV